MAHINHDNLNIDYNNVIPKTIFIEFLDTLKKLDIDSYNEEGADGFKDLYNYWSGCGRSRFVCKLIANQEKLSLKQS